MWPSLKTTTRWGMALSLPLGITYALGVPWAQWYISMKGPPPHYFNRDGEPWLYKITEYFIFTTIAIYQNKGIWFCRGDITMVINFDIKREFGAPFWYLGCTRPLGSKHKTALLPAYFRVPRKRPLDHHLGPLFWECPHPRAFTLHVRLPFDTGSHFTFLGELFSRFLRAWCFSFMCVREVLTHDKGPWPRSITLDSTTCNNNNNNNIQFNIVLNNEIIVLKSFTQILAC